MLNELIEGLVNDLETGSNGAVDPIGIPVYAAWPQPLNVPAALVAGPQTGTYVGFGQFKGVYEVALDIQILVAKGDPETVRRTVNALIERVLLNTTDWAFRGADSIDLYSTTSGEFPGTTIHLAKQDKLY